MKTPANFSYVPAGGAKREACYHLIMLSIFSLIAAELPHPIVQTLSAVLACLFLIQLISTISPHIELRIDDDGIVLPSSANPCDNAHIPFRDVESAWEVKRCSNDSRKLVPVTHLKTKSGHYVIDSELMSADRCYLWARNFIMSKVTAAVTARQKAQQRFSRNNCAVEINCRAS